MRPELVLRRTYNDHPNPADDDKFWTVLHQRVSVGVVVYHQGASDIPPDWDWVIHMHPGGRDNGVRAVTPVHGREATRDACLPPFREAFERYLEFIGPEGWALHVEHMRRISR